MLKKFLPGFVIVLFLCACSGKKNVDLILHHAVIYTVDSAMSVKEAIAIRDGKIEALGSSDEILKKYAGKEIIDAQGKAIFPGFIDAHCHFLNYGLGLQQVDLTGTSSFDEVLERVISFPKKSRPEERVPEIRSNVKNDWILGRGWDQNDWADKSFPSKEKLDSLFPDRPVLLMRIDGHAALANKKALEAGGIDPATKISGGEIEMKNGVLTGILIDNAVDIIKTVIPTPDFAKLERALMEAQANCFSVGLTTVDDAGIMANEIQVIDQLQKDGKMKIRVYAMLSDSLENYEHYLSTGPYKTDRLNVRAFKFYADGALGSRGACLLKDYSDKPGWKGFLLKTKEHYEKHAKQMIEKGFQMNTHCIGDSAYRLMISIYKKAGATKAQRWRIEHAQIVDPADLKNSGDIIPSVQPTHATSDMYWAGERLGKERIIHAYAYKELLNACGTIALGTDFPVEDISPFRTFYAAVARKDAKGFPANGFQMENALSRTETLKGMTIQAAYANFEENEKGSLEKGKMADLIIVDTDLMSCRPEDILKAKVLATYLAGEKVFPR